MTPSAANDTDAGNDAYGPAPASIATLPGPLRTALTAFVDGRRLPPLPEFAMRLLGLRRLGRVLAGARRRSDAASFFDAVLAELSITTSVTYAGAGRLPTDRGVIIVANHAFGALDGIGVHELVRTMREDVRTVAVNVLGVVPEMRRACFFVERLDAASGPSTNSAAMRSAVRWLGGGHALVIFPSGVVARFMALRRHISEPPWNSSVARLVRVSGADVVPIWVHGTNSLFFHLLCQMYPPLSTALIVRELLNKAGRNLAITVGDALRAEDLIALGSDEAMTEAMRTATYRLARVS